MSALPELSGVPRGLIALASGVMAFPVAVLTELRRLNASLTDIRATLGPHLEHLPNLEALQGIKTSLDRLSEPGAALDRLADVSETLDRLAELEDVLRQLGTVTEHLPQLVTATTTLPQLPEHAEQVQMLVQEAVGKLDRLQPSLDRLGGQLDELQGSIDGLGGALGPLGRLADRVPGTGRRR